MSGAASPRPERPDFLPGYGLADHVHDVQRFPWSEAERRLERARSYWVCSVGDGGVPHAMPVWAVWLDGALRFSTDAASVKGRNLTARPRCIVHLESGDDVVLLHGVARVERDAVVLGRFVDAYREKYAVTVDVANPSFTVFTVRPTTALTWLEVAYPETATRWRFADVDAGG